MLELEADLPQSELFEILKVPGFGRAVSARQDLWHGQIILISSGLQSPVSHVISRPYKREVCATCFHYDRGREWKARRLTAGVSFCSSVCEDEWSVRNTGEVLVAHEMVEAHIKRDIKRSAAKGSQTAVGSGGSGADDDSHDTLGPQVVDSLWQKAEAQAEGIREARLAGRTSKLVRKASEMSTDPDILTYVLSGVLTAYEMSIARKSDSIASSETLLPMLFALAPDHDLFLGSYPTLEAYIAAFVILTAILPATLLHYTTASLTRALADRASHNAFSIRPFASPAAATTDDEFLGWGVWPQASFFNHSCRPNVRKERNGRSWRLVIDATEGVRRGEELRITYLGGDEKSMNLEERRSRLKAEWGFECTCQLCAKEASARG